MAGVALGQVLPQGSSDSDTASSAESFDSGGASADSGAGNRDDSGGDAAAESPEELSGKVRVAPAGPRS